MALKAALDSVRRDALLRAVQPMAPVRWVVSIGLFGITSLAAWLSPSPVRTAALVVSVALFFVALSDVLQRRRRAATEPPNVTRNLVTTWGLLLAADLATGGPASPLALGIPVLTLLLFLAVPRRVGLSSLVFQLVVFWIFGLAPRGLSGPDLPWPSIARSTGDPWLTPLALTVLSLAAARAGAVLDRVIGGLFEDLLRSREETLAEHRQALHDLTALSGEIAHELKNPLSSIKGLAGLIGRDLAGKSAERMTVLQREIERMRSSLDELLGLSRPLGPLSVEEASLSGLAEDVVRLHEGTAIERRITLVCAGSKDVVAACDPRKVKQILTNVLQNALEAAPRGSTVTVSVERPEGASSAMISVVDEGPGIAPEVRARLFQRGVTGKAEGSGIGLTIARSLARQHGGDLTLEDRQEGGARALLTLPVRGGGAK